MSSNYYLFRKNFSSGILDQELLDAPRYADDPLYDEIAVKEGHNLPSASADGITTDDQFRLVIWNGTINPGDDPSMEIVTATITSHPRVFQVVTRGEENTIAAAHPVGSYVGLHYTAGVSLADLEPIADLLSAAVGSLFYTWSDVFGNRQVGILAPGLYGQVLVTAGTGHRPFWDWIWGAPGATYGRIKQFYPNIYSGVVANLLTIDCERLVIVPGGDVYAVKRDNITDPSYFNEFNMEDPDSYVDGSMEVSIAIEVLDFSGSSFSEPVREEEAIVASSYGYVIT